MDLRDQLQETLGDAYTLERELGGGGMSRVFVAEEKALGRKVVVKVLPGETAAQVSLERFKREILLAAKLQHPHIIPLLSAGEVPPERSEGSPLPYFTMPFVEGESLRSRLARHGELPIPDAMRILREIAAALAYAHERGIVHRDIKPDNVLLSAGSAMVTDFGVAKALSASSNAGHGGVTSIGVALGTPAYMSPEQAVADPAIDHRADVYAFGVLAYELLTGQPPFTGRTPQSLLAAHVSEPPEPIGKRRSNLPPALSALVMRCLEKRPADRPQSASEIVRALDDITTPSGGMQPTGRTPALEPSGDRMSARGNASRLGAVIVAAVLGIGAVGWWATHRTGTAPASKAAGAEHRIAVMPFTNVGHDSLTAPFADGMTDELIAALGKVRGLRVASRNAVYAWHDSTIDAKRVGARLGVDALLTATVQRSANRLKVTAQLVNVEDGLSSWAGSYLLDAKDMFAVEDSIARAIVAELKISLGAGQTTVVTAGTQDVEAHNLYLQGMFHSRQGDLGSEPESRKAIALFEQAIAKDPRYAAPWAGIAHAWTWLADLWLPPKDAYPKARRAALEALRLDSTNASAHSQIAAVFTAYDWDLTAAEREYDRALALDARDFDALQQLPSILQHRGLRDSVLVLARRGIDSDPVALTPYITLVSAFEQFAQLDSAEVWIRKAYEIASADSLGFVILRAREGRWAECVSAADHSQLAGFLPLARMMRASCEARLGRTADARKRISGLVAEREKHYVDGAVIAVGYAWLGDRDAAFRWLDQAFDDRSAEMMFLWEWFFDPIRSDPRFKALEQRVAAAANKAP